MSLRCIPQFDSRERSITLLVGAATLIPTCRVPFTASLAWHPFVTELLLRQATLFESLANATGCECEGQQRMRRRRRGMQTTITHPHQRVRAGGSIANGKDRESAVANGRRSWLFALKASQVIEVDALYQYAGNSAPWKRLQWVCCRYSRQLKQRRGSVKRTASNLLVSVHIRSLESIFYPRKSKQSLTIRDVSHL